MQEAEPAVTTLAAEIRRQRAAAGLSQEQLAVLIHYGDDRISKAEQGRHLPSAAIVAAIDDALNAGGRLTAMREKARQERALLREGIVPERDAPGMVAAARGEPHELLGHAAAVTVGAVLHDPNEWSQPIPHEESPIPARVGLGDVAQMRAIAQELRALDYRFGGGVCRDAADAQVRRTQLLLTADCTDDVRSEILLALADIHNVAGWTAFDVGRYSVAVRHFARALEMAHFVGAPSLVANILYRMGRVHLHRGMHRVALKFFQLGQIAAQDSGCDVTVAMLCANEAWAYALLGDSPQAIRSIGRAADELARTDPEAASPWVSFFGAADLKACEGMAYAALAASDRRYEEKAIDSLEASLGRRGPEMSRSRAFELAALAAVQLSADEVDLGISTGNQAVDLASRLRSTRVTDRLAPLRGQAEARARRSGPRDLAARVAGLQAT